MLRQLKRILLVFIGMMVTGILSCGSYSWYEDIDYFKKEGGIIIDKPIKNNDGTWFLPVSFETRIGNTAHMFKDVKPYLKGNTIQIRVLVGLFQSGSNWVKGANIGKLSDGMYQIQYLNSDGSTVDVGKIEIRN